MWFEDLTPYTYGMPFRHHLASDDSPRWRNPVLNVGWLEGHMPYTTGDVPDSVLRRLRVLLEYGRVQQTRGWHSCSLCDNASMLNTSPDGLEPIRSSAELRIMGADGIRYTSPLLILHYITAHRYRPPAAFLNAVYFNQFIDPEETFRNERCLGCGSVLELDVEMTLLSWPDSCVTVMCPGCETTFHKRTTPRHVEAMERRLRA